MREKMQVNRLIVEVVYADDLPSRSRQINAGFSRSAPAKAGRKSARNEFDGLAELPLRRQQQHISTHNG
jgi:hypothetical protein